MLASVSGGRNKFSLRSSAANPSFFVEECVSVILRLLHRMCPIPPNPIHSIPQLPKHRCGVVLFPWQRFPLSDLCVLLEQAASPRKQQDDPAHSFIFCALGLIVSRFWESH